MNDILIATGFALTNPLTLIAVGSLVAYAIRAKLTGKEG